MRQELIEVNSVGHAVCVEISTIAGTARIDLLFAAGEKHLDQEIEISEISQSVGIDIASMRAFTGRSRALVVYRRGGIPPQERGDWA